MLLWLGDESCLLAELLVVVQPVTAITCTITEREGLSFLSKL